MGFVHTGKSLAFVYDIADLYKCDTTVPAAFRAAASGPMTGIEARTRSACRSVFRESKLLSRIVPDLMRLFGLKEMQADVLSGREDLETVGHLWSEGGEIPGGKNYAAPKESGVLEELYDSETEEQLEEEGLLEAPDEGVPF